MTKEEPNSYNPNLHVRHEVPGYKHLWIEQKQNNKILLYILLFLVIIIIGEFAGAVIWNKNLIKQVSTLKAELVSQKDQTDIGLNMAVKYADYTEQLETELASCSAKLQEKKLSPKAKAHVKQQPIVAEKIKQVFGSEWAEATELYSRESSLNPLAENKSSGACGLVQALPCTKLVNKCALTDIDCQLKWGKQYISSRYGNASNALAFHDIKGWY